MTAPATRALPAQQRAFAKAGNGGGLALDPELGVAIEIPPVCTWAASEPAPREWTWHEHIPAGRVTSLLADGGVGKTLLAQMIGTAVGGDVDLFGIKTASGSVVGIFCEDEVEELQRRQPNICRALGIDQSELANVHFLSRVGENNLLATYINKEAFPTAFYWELDATCAELHPHLLIIDTAADTYGGNPIEQIEVRQFVQFILGGLCKRHGCTIVLTMHPSAAGIASGEGNGFSVAWNNTVRSRLYLAHSKINGQPDFDRVTLTRKKSNYARKGDELHLIYQNGAWALDPDPPISGSGGALRPAEMEAYATLLAVGKGDHVRLGIWTEACVKRGLFNADSTQTAREKGMERICRRLLGAGMVARGQGMRGFYRAVRVADTATDK